MGRDSDGLKGQRKFDFLKWFLVVLLVVVVAVAAGLFCGVFFN